MFRRSISEFRQVNNRCNSRILRRRLLSCAVSCMIALIACREEKPLDRLRRASARIPSSPSPAAGIAAERSAAPSAGRPQDAGTRPPARAFYSLFSCAGEGLACSACREEKALGAELSGVRGFCSLSSFFFLQANTGNSRRTRRPKSGASGIDKSIADFQTGFFVSKY